MELTESQFSQLSPMDDVMVEDPELPTGMCWLTMTVYSSGAHIVGISLLEIYI